MCLLVLMDETGVSLLGLVILSLIYSPHVIPTDMKHWFNVVIGQRAVDLMNLWWLMLGSRKFFFFLHTLFKYQNLFIAPQTRISLRLTRVTHWQLQRWREGRPFTMHLKYCQNFSSLCPRETQYTCFSSMCVEKDICKLLARAFNISGAGVLTRQKEGF